MERKSTLAIKIKAGDEAVPIIEDRYSRVFANSVPRNVGAPEHARVEPLEPDDQREPPPANIAVPAPAAVIEEVPAPAQETLEVSEAEVTPDKVFARNMCLVCGYDGLHAPPFDENGVSNQEICPCCGFQFGYDDTRRGVLYEDARKRWVAVGMPWFSQSVNKPRFWDAAIQLRRVDGSG